MVGFDITSIYSEDQESSIYDTDIVQRGIEEFERNQRLRQYGLTSNIVEERQIDLIDSIRDADYSTRLIEESDADQKDCLRFLQRRKLKDFALKNKKKCLIVIISLVIIVSVISLGIFWSSKHYKISNDKNTTIDITTNNPVTGTEKIIPTPGTGENQISIIF